MWMEAFRAPGKGVPALLDPILEFHLETGTSLSLASTGIRTTRMGDKL
jgi:hypothetical protein